jgi:hypothetical protein
MKTLLRLLPLFVFGALFARPTPKPHEEIVFLFENRKVTVAVPDGFGTATSKDSNGIITLRLADLKEHFSLECIFLPDPEGEFTNARARKEKLVEIFDNYVASSKEKGMQFEELEPRTGAGTYCVFTDSVLLGKPQVPRGEFLHLTAGLKAWPGVVAIFRLFSNETNSAAYQSVLKMLRESVDEKPAPMR